MLTFNTDRRLYVRLQNGKSAYDIWRENQPIGSDTSLEAYLMSMQGKEGVGIERVTVTTEPVTSQEVV
jgi:hypothetical protein